jgi:hypothetical protein
MADYERALDVSTSMSDAAAIRPSPDLLERI